MWFFFSWPWPPSCGVCAFRSHQRYVFMVSEFSPWIQEMG
jgi:hypothetical protein